MKVVWIVPGFSSNEQDWCIPALLDLARVMAERCELHIVALRYPYRRDRYSVYGATVHSIGGGNRGQWNTPGIWREALRVIGQLNYDVVHAFWLYESGLIAARLTPHTPIVISLAGGELIDLPDIQYGLARKFYLRWLMRWSLRRADVVTAGSKYLIDLANQFEKIKRIEFAPQWGMDVELFNSAQDPSSLQPAAASVERVVLNVGSLEPIKDHATLLRAFRRVHDQLPGTRLIIAGDGSLRDPLQWLAHDLNLFDCVTFRGAVPHEQLPELYRSAAMYAQSSRHESQGMAVLEAAACGVPVVGTRVGVVSDLAPQAAIATPIGDADALAAAMLAMLQDPDRGRAMNRAARSIIERDYTLERSADRFQQIYRQLIGVHD